MRKNKTMRAAVLLLALVLITSCFVGGTFAKYTTNANGTDTARVAKFNVTITANGGTFYKGYTADNSSTSTASEAVALATDTKIVAPGTGGTMTAMTLSGTPEVAVKVSYKGEFSLGDGWTAGSAFYCPLVIKVNGTQVNTSAATDADSFAKAVNDAIAAVSKEYAPGTDLNKVGTAALAVTWEWPFAVNDAKDTELGNAGSAQVTLKVTTTVEQIATVAATAP